MVQCALYFHPFFFFFWFFFFFKEKKTFLFVSLLWGGGGGGLRIFSVLCIYTFSSSSSHLSLRHIVPASWFIFPAGVACFSDVVYFISVFAAFVRRI